MSPGLAEADLLERRRQIAWRRLATPEAPPEPAPLTAEPYSLGYPTHHLLARALLPVALAFLLYVLNTAARPDASDPRGNPSTELRQ